MARHKVYTFEKDMDGVEWVQARTLMKVFDMSRTTVYRLCTDMQMIPKYKGAFIALSPKLKLIKLADFNRFLHERNGLYLRK